ncbi:hypothetical protein HMPREF9145_0366 [Segatella salivae F0493]|uniref:Uncharacterized protein n=1 Tax=Segatella salivae F0493 TaxID=1395125 RepID=U2KUI5_9BACT|nr:hypothetical protein HMPREF9145_0366 [Segatella salivae F0493]
MIKHCNAWENIIPMAQNQIIYHVVYAKMQDDVYTLRRTMIDIVRRSL